MFSLTLGEKKYAISGRMQAAIVMTFVSWMIWVVCRISVMTEYYTEIPAVVSGLIIILINTTLTTIENKEMSLLPNNVRDTINVALAWGTILWQCTVIPVDWFNVVLLTVPVLLLSGFNIYTRFMKISSHPGGNVHE